MSHMIVRAISATGLTVLLILASVNRDLGPLALFWAAVAGALWLSLALDKVERKR